MRLPANQQTLCSLTRNGVSKDISLIQRTKQAQCVTCPNSVDRRSLLPYRLAKVSESVHGGRHLRQEAFFGIRDPESG
jgi:hypothetical protein